MSEPQTNTDASNGAVSPPANPANSASQAQDSLLNAMASEAGKGDAAPTKAPAEKPPEAYKFKLPDGLTEKDDLVGEVTDMAKAAGLSAEQAQKLLDSAFANEKALADKYAAEQTASHTKAIEQLKADPEFGGEKFKDSMDKAGKAIKRFFTDAELSSLAKAGLANSPELVKAFARIGRVIGEDAFVKGAGPGAKPPASLDERFMQNFK